MKENSTAELLYIWICEDETGFIRNQGFNLSPEFHFETQQLPDQRLTLTCTRNHNRPNVWKTGRIVNLTAIVGKNGSGKSSLLRHLAFSSLIPASPRDQARAPFLWMVQVYRINGAVQIYHNFPESSLDNKTGYPVTCFNAQGKCTGSAEGQHEPDPLNPQTKLYLSNAFSSSSSAWNSKGHLKPVFFSTTGNFERSKAFFQQISGQNLSEHMPWNFCRLQQKVIESRKFKDFEQLCALSYYHRLKTEEIKTVLLAARHREIVIGVTSPAQWYFKSFGMIPRHKNTHPLYSMQEKYFSSSRRPDLFSALRDNLILEITHLFAPAELDESTYKQICDAPLDYLKQCNADPKVLQYYESAFRELEQFEGIVRYSYFPPAKALNDTRCVPCNAVIPPWSYEHDLFCKYIDGLLQKDTSFILKYLIVEMPPLSSGEQALQNIFTWLKLAPFYHKITNDEILPRNDSILLLLDEVDLYMHPEWQRKFLKYLSDELERQYPDKHIQVIISTHSPLVLSDIPSCNIIYLQKNADHCSLSLGPEQKESFGANIFSLLKDSFFLEHSMGAFAHDKISGIIDALNQLKQKPHDNALRQQCRELRPLIDIIGEPAVRRKLQITYDDLFRTAPRDREQDMNILRQLLESDDPSRGMLEDIIANARSRQEGGEA